MGGKYFCYNCQLVVSVLHSPTRPSCSTCFRDSIEKISEDADEPVENENISDEDTPLDPTLNLLEGLTVQSTDSGLLGGDPTFDEGDAFDDSFSDTPSFLAGYLGIDPGDDNDWVTVNEEEEQEDDYGYYYDLYLGITRSEEVLWYIDNIPFLETYDGFLAEEELARRLEDLHWQTGEEDGYYNNQDATRDWYEHTLPRFEELSKRVLIDGDFVIQTKTDCIICQETYNVGMTLTKMSCGHEYHNECLLQWLEQSPTCPICRSAL